MQEQARLVVAGLGYSGAAIAAAARDAGFLVTGTARDPGAVSPPPGVGVVAFAAAAPAIMAATHLVVTAAPDAAGDPVLAAHGAAVAAAPGLRWVGYLSTTGVYGDRGGGRVNEATPPAPGQERSLRRLAAEQAWAGHAPGRAVDLFRVGGIYGPGRTPFAELRAGTARRVVKPGHVFGRIHRDDIAGAVLAAMLRRAGPGVSVFNLVDDAPAENAAVIAAAAELLGVPAPAAVPYAEAIRTMSPMARSFWEESRLVDNAATKAALGLVWRYPTYREGLAASLVEERRQDLAQNGEVRRP